METVMLPDVTHDCFSKNERKILHSDKYDNNNIKDDLSTNSNGNDIIAHESSEVVGSNNNNVVPSFISLLKDSQPIIMSLTDREDLLTLAQHKFDEIRRGSKGFSLFANRKSQQVSSSSSSSEPLPKSVQMLSTLLYLSLMMHKVEDIKQILMQADPKSYHEWQNLFDVLHSPVFFSNERCIQNTRVKKIFKRKQNYKHKLFETEKKLVHQKELTNKIQTHANQTTNKMSDSIQKLTEETTKSKDTLNEKQKIEMKLLLASKEIELLGSNVTSLDSEIARSNHHLFEMRDTIKTMEVERAKYMKELEILRNQEKKLEGVVISLTKELDDKRIKLDSLSEKLTSSNMIHEDVISKWNEKYIQVKEATATTNVELKSTKDALIRSQVELQGKKDVLLKFQKKHESTTLEMHEKSLAVKGSTAITETELRFTKQLLEEIRHDLNHTKEALTIAVKALSESRASDIKETLRLKELLSSSKSELDHLNEKLIDSELKVNDLSYSKQSSQEEHENKYKELKNTVTKFEVDLKITSERAQQAESALDYSATVAKLVDEKSAYLKENERLKEEMESKNCELAQLSGKLEYVEMKVNDAFKEKEEQSSFSDKKCDQLKSMLLKLEDEVKTHSNRAHKAEDNVDLVVILKALVEEKATELKSRDKLNELLHSNSCEVNKLNERLKDSSIKVNDLANDKKLTSIHHQRACVDLRDKVSKLESEVTSSSNRVRLAEEKLNVAKSLSTLVDERNKEVEANEKLKEMIHTNKCELIQYSEKLKQSEAKIEDLVNDKESTKEIHNKECSEMNSTMVKLQIEIETCTNRAMKAEENLNLSNALSSLIEDKISDTKANETMLELLNSNKKELSHLGDKLKETELTINDMVNEKIMNSVEKLKESELKVNDLVHDSKLADELYQKQCQELNDKIIVLQTEVAAYSESALNAEKNLNLANSIAELIEERTASTTSFQNITKLLDENKCDLAELNENILGTENKISTLIDKKMVNSNERLDESSATVTKLETEKKVYSESHEKERDEYSKQILKLQSDVQSCEERAQKAEDNMQLANAVTSLTENKDLNLKQHEEVTKFLDSNKDDLNILKGHSKQTDSKLTKLSQVENEIRGIIKDKMIHSNKKLLETEMNMKALIADKQLNETIHGMECNELSNRLAQLENVVSIYKSRALKAEDNLHLANILAVLTETKATDQKNEENIDELLEFNRRALLAFNENLEELDSKIDALVESREADTKPELKTKDKSLDLVGKTLLNFQSELDTLKNKALLAEENLKVANNYASFTESVDVKYEKLSKLLESNKEELNRLNENLHGTDSKISQLLTSSNNKTGPNENSSITEKLSNIEYLLEASSLSTNKESKESKNGDTKSIQSALAVNEKLIHIACDDNITLLSKSASNGERSNDQKDDNKDDCVSAITSENFEFDMPNERDPHLGDSKLNDVEASVTSETTSNPSNTLFTKDTSVIESKTVSNASDYSITSQNFESDSHNENTSVGENNISLEYLNASSNIKLSIKGETNLLSTTDIVEVDMNDALTFKNSDIETSKDDSSNNKIISRSDDKTIDSKSAVSENDNTSSNSDVTKEISNEAETNIISTATSDEDVDLESTNVELLDESSNNKDISGFDEEQVESDGTNSSENIDDSSKDEVNKEVSSEVEVKLHSTSALSDIEVHNISRPENSECEETKSNNSAASDVDDDAIASEKPEESSDDNSNKAEQRSDLDDNSAHSDGITAPLENVTDPSNMPDSLRELEVELLSTKNASTYKNNADNRVFYVQKSTDEISLSLEEKHPKDADEILLNEIDEQSDADISGSTSDADESVANEFNGHDKHVQKDPDEKSFSAEKVNATEIEEQSDAGTIGDEFNADESVTNELNDNEIEGSDKHVLNDPVENFLPSEETQPKEMEEQTEAGTIGDELNADESVLNGSKSKGSDKHKQDDPDEKSCSAEEVDATEIEEQSDAVTISDEFNTDESVTNELNDNESEGSDRHALNDPVEESLPSEETQPKEMEEKIDADKSGDEVDSTAELTLGTDDKLYINEEDLLLSDSLEFEIADGASIEKFVINEMDENKFSGSDGQSIGDKSLPVEEKYPEKVEEQCDAGASGDKSDTNEINENESDGSDGHIQNSTDDKRVYVDTTASIDQVNITIDSTVGLNPGSIAAESNTIEKYTDDMSSSSIETHPDGEQYNAETSVDDIENMEPLYEECNENSNERKNIGDQLTDNEAEELYNPNSENNEQTIVTSLDDGSGVAASETIHEEAASNNIISATTRIKDTLESSSSQELSMVVDPNTNSTECIVSSYDDASLSNIDASFSHREMAVEVVTEAVETATSNISSHHESQGILK